MVVLDPLEVTITDFPTDHNGTVEIPDFPADEKKGKHSVPFKKTIFIERDDFKEVRLVLLFGKTSH